MVKLKNDPKPGGNSGESGKGDIAGIKNRLEVLKNATEVKDMGPGSLKKQVDPFITLKLHILDVLDETRKCVRERESIQKFHGNNIEVIKRGNIIYNHMKNIDTYFLKLEEILNKQMKQKYVYSQEEIQDKQETFDILKKQIYDCKKLSNFDVIRPTTVMDFNELKNKKEVEKIDTSIENTHDDEDLIIINRWKERDKQFNEEILQIGEVLDRIGQNADVITKQAEHQNEIIMNLQDQTDKVQDNVKEANENIKKLMITQSHATWCCRISFLLILVILILLIITVLFNKFLKW